MHSGQPFSYGRPFFQVLSIQSIHFSLLNVLELSLYSTPFSSLFLV
jgi:hypothetical protein